MRKVFIILAILILSHSSFAQWKKIADFPNKNAPPFNEQVVTCVYFIDLPGPPRIGFAGTDAGLWKTIDGGKTWTYVWGNGYSYGQSYVSDICFKDSLTGWFSYYDGSGSIGDTVCGRTTDGGETWEPIAINGAVSGSRDVCYQSGTNRLFLSIDGGDMELSTDLGDNWHSVTNIETGGISFASDSMGIAASYPSDSGADTVHWIVRTSNGGLSWISVSTPSYCQQPLMIPGTSICFACTWIETMIYRSDDYGATWRKLYDFGPVQDSNFNQIAPYGNGIIRGDLSKLYIQTDEGMYISTDEGITWDSVGNPEFEMTGGIDDFFYVGKGIAMAGMSYDNNSDYASGGLWEEEWPQSGVAESAPANSAINLRVFPNPASGALQIICEQTGEIHLFDLMGRERMNAISNGTGATLDVSRLEAGMYFVRLGNQSTKVTIAH